jgi:hypothetical protein
MVASWILVVAIVGIGVVAFASFVPLPDIGIQLFNSTVTVSSYEIPLAVGDAFGITSVTGHTTGGSTLIDWTALGIGFPSIEAQFKMTVCETPAGGGPTCTSESASQWFPSIPILNGGQVTSTNSFVLGFVSPGSYGITVQLTDGGSVVATGSGSTCVPGC